MQMNVLRRTHQLLSEYVPLPMRWSQLWNVADVAAVEVNEWRNEAAENSIYGILLMLKTAAFDSHTQAFLPDTSSAASSLQQQLQQQQQSGSVIPEECGYSRCSSPFQQCQENADGAPTDRAVAGPGAASDILAEVQQVLQPYRAFFGRQHLLALQQLGGCGALCMLREAGLSLFQDEQVSQCNFTKRLPLANEHQTLEMGPLLLLTSCCPGF